MDGLANKELCLVGFIIGGIGEDTEPERFRELVKRGITGEMFEDSVARRAWMVAERLEKEEPGGWGPADLLGEMRPEDLPSLNAGQQAMTGRHLLPGYVREVREAYLGREERLAAQQLEEALGKNDSQEAERARQRLAELKRKKEESGEAKKRFEGLVKTAMKSKGRKVESILAEIRKLANETPGLLDALGTGARTHGQLRADKALKPLPYMIQGIVRKREVTMVVSDPGLGKTMLGLAFAVGCAAGVRVLRCRCRKVKVVYIDLEMGEWDERLRTDAIARALGVAGDNLAIIHLNSAAADGAITLDNLEEKVVEACLQKAVECPGEGWEDMRGMLIIVDTFRDATPGVDHCDSDAANKAVAKLGKFVKGYDSSAIVFHHTNRRGDFGGAQAILGSVDNMLLLRWAQPRWKETAGWAKRAEALGMKASKGFVVLEVKKARRGDFLPRLQHLWRAMIQRDPERPKTDDDCGATDGFLWLTLGEVGKESLNADERAFLSKAVEEVDAEAEGNEGEGGDEEEDEDERKARFVAEAFKESTSAYKTNELIARCVECGISSESVAKKAVQAANRLKYIHKLAGKFTEFTLTTKGGKAWEGVHSIVPRRMGNGEMGTLIGEHTHLPILEGGVGSGMVNG